MNEALATRIVTLLVAGEVDESVVGENAMNTSDITRTLDTGGVSSIGYASTDVTPAKEGLAHFKEAEEPQSESTDAEKINLIDWARNELPAHRSV
nr:hypothetical protein [Halorubrum sp. PV6]